MPNVTLIPVVYVCMDGVIVEPEYAYDAKREMVDAVGAAIVLKRENPDSVVTLLFEEVPEVAR